MDSLSEHVLVLEDGETYRSIVELNLSQTGLRVATAATAVEALLLARQEHFDLVIADYYLPDYPGTDFVRLLRQTDGYRNTPVILLTAWADELNRQRLCEDLLVLVLSKSCSMKRLLDAVFKCLAVVRLTS
ncbi:MAG TPA: response regulator [Thermoguttaceae bacterium]|nr:response regulator [Thermoguttaceae bacterium]